MSFCPGMYVSSPPTQRSLGRQIAFSSWPMPFRQQRDLLLRRKKTKPPCTHGVILNWVLRFVGETPPITACVERDHSSVLDGHWVCLGWRLENRCNAVVQRGYRVTSSWESRTNYVMHNSGPLSPKDGRAPPQEKSQLSSLQMGQMLFKVILWGFSDEVGITYVIKPYPRRTVDHRIACVRGSENTPIPWGTPLLEDRMAALI